MARRKGRAATGILSFIFGFIFAIIAEVALIVGGVYWALNTNINDMLSYFGIENVTEDESGETDYVYINTETASTLSELISVLKDLYSLGTDELTIGDIVDLFPITGTTIEDIYSSVNDSVGNDFDLNEIINYDDMLATPLSGLSEFISESIQDSKVSLLMQAAGVDIEAEKLYMIVAYGSEAGYVTINGTDYVLYYDTYDHTDADNEQGTEEKYTRYINVLGSDGKYDKEVDDAYISQTNNSTYWDYIYSSSIDNRIYYYVSDSGTPYVVTRDNDDTDGDGNIYSATDAKYTLYNTYYSTITGGYYYDSNGDLVILNYRLLSDFLSGGLDSLFYDIYITELMETDDESSSDSNDFILELLDGVSLGALLNGEVNFSDLLGNIYVTDFLGDDETLSKLFDGITLADLIDGTVDFDELLEKIYIADFIDVEIDESDSSATIMAYVAYSITDITAAKGRLLYNGSGVDYTYTATLHMYDESGTDTTYTAYITTDTDESGATIITGVYYYTDNDSTNGTLTLYEGVKVGDISDQASRLMDVLTVSDMMDVEVGQDSTAIMAYISYGLSGLTDTGSDTTINSTAYSVYTATYHTYASDGDGTDANYSYNGNTVYVLVNNSTSEVYAVYGTASSTTYSTATYSNNITSTPVSYISDRIDGLMSDLTIGEITDLGTSKVAQKLSGYTISNVGSFLESLTIADVMDIEQDSAIMAYLGYGVSDLTATDNSGDPYTVTIESVEYKIYTATYNAYGTNSGQGGTNDDSNYTYDNQSVYVLVDSTGNIYGVYGSIDSGSLGSSPVFGSELTSTPVADISNRLDGLMEDLTIGEISGIGTDDDATTIEKKIGASTINGISGVIDGLTVVDAMGEVEVGTDNTALMAYLGYGLTQLTDTNTDTTIETVTYSVYKATYNAYGDNSGAPSSYEDPNYSYDGQTVYVLVNKNETSDTTINSVYTTMSGTLGSNPTFSGEITSTLINNISDRIEGLMDDLTVGDLLGIDDTETNAVLVAIKDSTLSGLSDDIENLTLQELYCNFIYKTETVNSNEVAIMNVVYKSSSGITYYYYDTNETSYKSTNVSSSSYQTLGDSNTSGTYLYQVNQSVSGVTTVYYYNSTTQAYYPVVDFNVAYLYYECINGSFSYITGESDQSGGNYTGHLDALTNYSSFHTGSGSASVTASEGADGMLYTYGAPQGIWKFLLYGTRTISGTSTSVEVTYSVGDISNLTTNASSNIKSATLNELVSAGLIESNDSFSTTTVKRSTLATALNIDGASLQSKYSDLTSDDSTITLGELMLSDVISFFVYLVGQMNTAGGGAGG